MYIEMSPLFRRADELISERTEAVHHAGVGDAEVKKKSVGVEQNRKEEWETRLMKMKFQRPHALRGCAAWLE